jgi:hypothetical protein
MSDGRSVRQERLVGACVRVAPHAPCWPFGGILHNQAPAADKADCCGEYAKDNGQYRRLPHIPLPPDQLH